MDTHKLIDGVALAIDAVTDCKNSAEFKAWVAEKNAAGACIPWNADRAGEVYDQVMSEVNAAKASSSPKAAASGKSNP